MGHILLSVLKSSPAGAFLRCASARVAVFGVFIASAAIALSSMVGGIAWTTVSVEFFIKGVPRGSYSVFVGYMNQLHYGPWYVLTFPLVSAAAFIIVRHIASGPNPVVVGRGWKFALLGWILFALFVGIDVGEELGKFHSLGLGWVQSRGLAKCSKRLVSATGSYCRLEQSQSPLDQRRLLIKEEGRFVPADSGHITAVTPAPLHVPPTGFMAIFTVIAKSWNAFWETLIVYIGVFAGYWGFRALPMTELVPEVAGANQLTGIERARRIIVCLYFLGVAAGVRELLRMFANFGRGTFGGLDENLSTLTLLPGLVALIATLYLLLKIQFDYVGDEPNERILTRWTLMGAGSFSLLVVGLVGGFLLSQNSPYLALIQDMWKFVYTSVHLPTVDMVLPPAGH